MDVNMTLVLQAMQFGCVYYCLYNFVFAPAYKIIDEKDEFARSLRKKLEQEMQTKDILLAEYNIKNAEFKSSLMQTIPQEDLQDASVVKTSHSSTLYSIEPVCVSDEDKKKAESFLVNYLSKVVKK